MHSNLAGLFDITSVWAVIIKPVKRSYKKA